MKKLKPKRKKKNVIPDDKEQSARFIETAERIALVKNPEEVFEKAVKSIIMHGKTE
jgi:hypothetical protein